jgi:decaprenylphospho-beta-D-ribofuranose 2-oxidase
MVSSLIKKQLFRSFDKSYESEILIAKPDRYRDIEKKSLLSDNLITMGSALSYAPASFKKNSLSLIFEKFDRIIEFDKKNKTITVEGGITFQKFLNFTLSQGLWIPQIPGYPLISIAGAVATNAHGKSCGYHGTIRNQIKKITLYHKENGWLKLSEKENRETFELTIGGFGLTGTIVDVTFDLYDFEGFNFSTSIENVNSTTDTINKIKNERKNENYIYSWNRLDQSNKLGNGFIFQNQINLNDKKKNLNKINCIDFNHKKKNLPFSLWNGYSIKFFNNIYFYFHKYLKKKKYYDEFQNVIFPFIGKERYFDMFGTKGFVESQILVSNKYIELFIEEFEYLHKKYAPSITLFSIKNMNGKQNYLRFEDNSICLTFDFIRNNKNLEFMKFLDELCIKYQALPSIIKDSRISKNIVDKCYKHAEDFRNDLKKFDKKKIYRSELSDRLGL